MAEITYDPTDVDAGEFTADELDSLQVGEQLGMLPNIDKMFFEFIPKKEFDKKGLESTTRLLLTEVKKNVDYVFAVTTAGGLYSYSRYHTG